VNAKVGYTFQSLKNRDSELATRVIDDRQVTVASVDAGVTRDRRDNPLRPRRGYRAFAQVEAASRTLGADLAVTVVGGLQMEPAYLRAIAPDLVTLICGVAVLLVYAGIIEAFLSQYHEPVIPYALKITFGVAELIGLIAFLTLSGRQSSTETTPPTGPIR
jgi:hypothetical protein